MTALQRSFSSADLGVFGTVLTVSVAIGLYYACTGNRQRSTGEFFLGNRKLRWLPTAISLLVTFESSIFILGVPAEGYVYGVQMWVGPLGLCLASLLIAAIVPPLFYPLPIISVYQYLELRYKSRAVRLLGLLLGMLRQLLYMGIVVFGPALAFHAVSGFPVIASIFIVGLGSTLYTAIGGLKAVVWTDVFQSLIMYVGVFAILIQGTVLVGGPASVWNIAQDGGRLNFFDFRPDPRVRHTFWSLVLGFLVLGLDRGFQQSSLQRLLSQQTAARARRLWFLAAPAFLITMNLALYEGIVTYAYYVTVRCDPLASHTISNPNQVVVLMVMEVFRQNPGMAGVFLAALVSASLSTLSSSLSSLSVNVWEDLLKPHLGHLPDSRAALIAKLAVTVLGIFACGMAVLISLVGGTLTQIALSMISAFAAPTAGLFLLSCLFPWANKWGALVGTGAGLLVSCFLSFGASFSKVKAVTPWLAPAPLDGCSVPPGNVTGLPSNNVSTEVPLVEIHDVVNVTLTSAGPPDDTPQLEGIYKMFEMSYLLYGPFSMIVLLLVGNIVSIITGGNREDPVDPIYLFPVADRLCACFPQRWRRFLRCGFRSRKDEKQAAGREDSPLASEMTALPGSTRGENGRTPSQDDLFGLGGQRA